MFAAARKDREMDPRVRIYVLPGGQMPSRQTEGAVGFDVSLRAIVCATQMDARNAVLRKTLFDFSSVPDEPDVARHIVEVNGELVYRMDPGESVLGGLGFITEMPFPLFYWLTPRSGLSSKHGITLTNAPGTVDSDYRGEAGALIYNRNPHPYDLRHNMRIAQIIFQEAIIPKIEKVDTAEQLLGSVRGSGGFGSTGLR